MVRDGDDAYAVLQKALGLVYFLRSASMHAGSEGGPKSHASFLRPSAKLGMAQSSAAVQAARGAATFNAEVEAAIAPPKAGVKRRHQPSAASDAAGADEETGDSGAAAAPLASAQHHTGTSRR